MEEKFDVLYDAYKQINKESRETRNETALFNGRH